MQTFEAKRELENAKHAFGVKTGALNNIEDNIRLLTERLGPIAYMRQVHGNGIAYATGPGMIPEADAIYTDHRDLWLAVSTADLMPLLISSPHAVAAVHGGWRTLANGLLTETIEVLYEEFATDPTQFSMHIGPCIHQKNYEVDADIVHEFDVAYEKFFRESSHAGKMLMDMPGLARQIAMDAGIPSEAIFDVDMDTYEKSDLFFSYRRSREEERDGNNVQFSLVKLK